VRLEVGFRWEVHYILSNHDQNHRIDDRRPQTVGLFGPNWAYLNIDFLFLFFFFFHHCEVTLKTKYIICTNIFFIYNSMYIKFSSRFAIFYYINEFLHVY
jgi:hypothetical protein